MSEYSTFLSAIARRAKEEVVFLKNLVLGERRSSIFRSFIREKQKIDYDKDNDNDNDYFLTNNE